MEEKQIVGRKLYFHGSKNSFRGSKFNLYIFFHGSKFVPVEVRGRFHESNLFHESWRLLPRTSVEA